MKAKVSSKTIKTCVVVLLAWISLVSTDISKGNTAGEFGPVDSNRIPEILTMISNQIRSNYERIKTWQSDVDFTIHTIYEGPAAERVFNTHTDATGKTPNALIEHMEGRRQFVVDLEKDFLYTNLNRENPSSYTDFESGRDLGTKSTPWQKISIVTPEYQVDCMGDTMRDGVVIRRRAVKQVRPKDSTCASDTHPVFDPGKCFVVGKPIWETFPRLLQYMQLHGQVSVDGYALKVEKCIAGNLMKYRIQIPGKVSPEDYMFVTMVFSGANGFNIISYEEVAGESRLLLKKSWDYDLVDDVYLPSEIVEQHFGQDGKVTRDKKSTFKNSQVNHTIAANTFSYKNLGLKNGDRFIDKILDKEYTYQDGELVEIQKKSK